MGGQKTYPRFDDERVLTYLHMRDDMGMSALKISRSLVSHVFSGSKGSVIGHLDRIAKGDFYTPCLCVTPENKDGGMAPLWWRQ